MIDVAINYKPIKFSIFIKLNIDPRLVLDCFILRFKSWNVFQLFTVFPYPKLDDRDVAASMI